MIGKSSKIEKSIIIFTDIFIIVLSYLFALWLRMHSGLFPKSVPIVFTSVHILTLFGVTLFQIYIFYEKGLYSEKNFLRRVKQVPIIIQSALITIIFLLFFSYLTKENPFLERRSVIIIAFIVEIFLLVFFRLVIFRNFFHTLLKKGIGKENVLIVGKKDIAERLELALYDFDRFRFLIKAKISENITVNSVEKFIETKRVDTVFFIEEGIEKNTLVNLIALCKNKNLQVFLLSNMFDFAFSNVDMTTFEGIPVIELTQKNKFFNLLIKRVIDIIVSLLLLLILLPFFLIISIIIKIDSSGPVFFLQERVGKNGKKFKMLKFRTMYKDNDERVHKEYVTKLIKEGKKDESGIYKIKDDPRITKIGKFLRAFSFDEFPQLINVLKGEMSLVGPRPPIEYEVENYDQWHKRRLSVKPGMTGMWQVSGRNRVGFEDMVLLDIYYVENFNIWLDIIILLKTIPAIVKREGE
ncbi:MAG: exopolysaccharide biosynthesis polyprenyl glycosylphosphotransferase [bacterium]|nr:exopolysaccharide biosynthesis polyprenyl glycosylphosphotransferase [bacterium]